MSRKVGYLAAALVAGGFMSFGGAVQAQVLDGTTGRISRCDLYKSLGKALPPECGGTGAGMGGVTRGRVTISQPGAAAPTAPVAAAPVRPAPVAAAPTAAPTAATPVAAAPTAAPTPAPTAATPAPGPTTTVAGAKGVGLPIPFELDSDVLRPQAMEIIDQLVEVFKANGTDRYIIEGHTDSSGDVEHNRALSERRAKAVVRYLVERHGLAETRFVTRGTGSANLLLKSDPFNARNRRVSIVQSDS